jgi:hypothetical protein
LTLKISCFNLISHYDLQEETMNNINISDRKPRKI